MNESQIHDGMLAGLEEISSLIVRYTMVEKLYLRGSFKLQDQLSRTLVNLYAAIMDFLAKAGRHFSCPTPRMA